MNKKLLTTLFACFLLLSASVCLAQTLEIDYPPLPNEGGLPANPPLPQYLKYLFSFGMWMGIIAAVLSLTIAGVFYLISPAKPEFRARAKDHVSGTILGLILLLITYLIITTINPELRFFRDIEVEGISSSTPKQIVPAGVYLYRETNCFDPSEEKQLVPYIYSDANLDNYKNILRSARIIHNPSDSLYYIGVLYDLINFQGKCKYIDPNVGCDPFQPFADSLSVYRYSHNPSGDGVWFYRKSFYNSEGGWYKVENSEIRNIYVGDLKNLKFNDVPEEEQDCVEWDLDGDCLRREIPNLAGENITSIKIDGNYFVLIVYFDPGNNPVKGPWSFCQAFPTVDDMNKEGPKQIRWEYIREQTGGNLPNFVIIFPVKQK